MLLYYILILYMHVVLIYFFFFFFSSRRRHTRSYGDWSSDVCSSDLQYWLRGNPLELGGQFSVAAYHAIQRESKVLQELAAWRTDGVLIEEEATSSLALEISCNFFAVYGLTRPSLGRLFGPDECASASEERVVVLSEEAWRSRFAADPHILGKVILLNRQPFAVIGITPMGFAGRLRGPGIWVPY